MLRDIDQTDKIFFLKNRKLGKDEFLNNYKEDIKDQIIKIVRFYSLKEGISLQKLADLIDIDRTNLRKTYTDPLMKENKINRKNKKSNFFINDDLSFEKDLLLNISLFSDKIRSKILFSNLPPSKLPTPPKFVITNKESETCIEDTPFDFTKYSELFEPKFTDKHILERKLFEFSNQIGAFITYLLIHSFELNSLLDKNNNPDSDSMIKTLVEKGSSRLIPYLPIIFMNWIYPELTPLPDYNKKEKIRDTISNKNNFINDLLRNENTIPRLVNTFTRLYPLMSYEIEKILPKQFRLSYEQVLKDEPSAIEQHKKEMKEQLELQQSTTKDNKKQISKKYKYNYYYEIRCFKCQHKRKITLKGKNDINRQKVRDAIEEHLKQSPNCKLSNLTVEYRKEPNKSK